MLKKYFLLFVSVIFLNSCFTMQIKGLEAVSLNDDWSVVLIPHYYRGNGYKIFIKNKTNQFISIDITNFKAEKKDFLFLYVPIPLLDFSNTEKNCNNIFILEFNTNTSYESLDKYKKIHYNI